VVGQLRRERRSRTRPIAGDEQALDLAGSLALAIECRITPLWPE
jgi:hypothetical protein